MKMFYYNGNFSIAENTIRFKTIDDTKFKTKMIYYYLLFNMKQIENCFRGQNQKQLSRDDFIKIRIPMPSLELQQKIIDELDAIYNTIDGLKKVVDNMKVVKQSTFNNILINYKRDNKLLKDILSENVKTGKNKPSDIIEDTNVNKNYPYFGTGGIKGYTNDFLIDGEYILTPRNGTIGTIFFHSGKSFPSDHMYIIKTNDKICTITYLKYVLLGNNLSDNKRGATIPNITKDNLENLHIQIPSISDQEKIVKEMEQIDNFEEQVKKQIINLEIQAKETLEQHLKSSKTEKNSIEEYNELMKEIGKNDCILKLESNDTNNKITQEYNKIIKKHKPNKKTNNVNTDDDSEEIVVVKKKTIKTDNSIFD